jgi:hypothetical protein
MYSRTAMLADGARGIQARSANEETCREARGHIELVDAGRNSNAVFLPASMHIPR